MMFRNLRPRARFLTSCLHDHSTISSRFFSSTSASPSSSSLPDVSNQAESKAHLRDVVFHSQVGQALDSSEIAWALDYLPHFEETSCESRINRLVATFDHWLLPCWRPPQPGTEWAAMFGEEEDKNAIIEDLKDTCLSLNDNASLGNVTRPPLTLDEQQSQIVWFPNPQKYPKTFSAFTHNDAKLPVVPVSGIELLNLMKKARKDLKHFAFNPQPDGEDGGFLSFKNQGLDVFLVWMNVLKIEEELFKIYGSTILQNYNENLIGNFPPKLDGNLLMKKYGHIFDISTPVWALTNSERKNLGIIYTLIITLE